MRRKKISKLYKSNSKIHKRVINFLFILAVSPSLITHASKASTKNSLNKSEISGVFDNSDPSVNKKFIGVNKTPADVDLTRNLNAVGTGPYFGIGSNYDGSDLVVLQPNIHKDLALLIQHKKTASYAQEKQGPHSPYVQLSGYAEAQALFENKSHNNINLTASNLDVSAWVNKWLTAYSNFGVDTDDTKDQSFRMIMGFVTLGNLEVSPFYASAGQMFVPFGSFSTGTSSIGTIPRNLGRILEQAISFGYYQENGLHVSGAFYDGKTQNSHHDNADQYAGTVSYTTPFAINNWPSKIRAGVSYTNNLADAHVFRTVFNNNASLAHYVPAYDLFTNANVGPVVLRWEYVQALTHFSKSDLTQNGRPVKPASFLSELEYDANIFGKGTAFVLHYSRIFQGAAASPVKHQYGGTVSVNILRDTLVSLEVAHQGKYSSTNVLPTPTATAFTVLNPAVVNGLNSSFSGRRNKFAALTVDVFF